MKSKCSSGGCHIGGGCSCGLFHSQVATNSFSMLFSMPVPTTTLDHHDSSMEDYNYYDSSPDHHRTHYINDYYYSNNNSSSSSSSPPSPALVDCTLSLATPSATTPPPRRRPPPSAAASSSPWSSSFCWDILHSSAAPALPNPKTCTVPRPSPPLLDPLLARRCANCDTTSTPLWRNGPRGPKSLCNACGIRFKKEERRANAAAATVSTGAGGGGDGVTQQQQHHHHISTNPWLQQFRFIDDVVDDRDSPFLSWRLNVTDRPALVHDFST